MTKSKKGCSKIFMGIKEGYKYYMEKATFDCKWYWGIGYITTRDSHEHFDSKFKNHEDFFNYFEDTPFNDSEKWEIYEIMTSLYTARKYSDMLHTGGAHITKNPCKDIIKDNTEYNRINKVVIPSLLKELYYIMEA